MKRFLQRLRFEVRSVPWSELLVRLVAFLLVVVIAVACTAAAGTAVGAFFGSAVWAFRAIAG